jgi:hypothetical protein
LECGHSCVSDNDQRVLKCGHSCVSDDNQTITVKYTYTYSNYFGPLRIPITPVKCSLFSK